MKRELLVPLITYPEASSDAVAPNAVAVARHLGADLHALDINVDIPDVSSALSGLLMKLPEKIRQAETTSRGRGQALLAVMKEMASRAGVSLTTSEIAAPPARFGEVAAANARYYDLSLIGWEAGNQAGRMTAEGVVFASGRPVVLLPDTTQIDSIDHVVIAWDGSRAAARAVADAHPFLERASEITVVTVLGEKSIREKDAERLTRELQKARLSGDGRRDPRRGLRHQRDASGACAGDRRAAPCHGRIRPLPDPGFRSRRRHQGHPGRSSPAGSPVALASWQSDGGRMARRALAEIGVEFRPRWSAPAAGHGPRPQIRRRDARSIRRCRRRR